MTENSPGSKREPVFNIPLATLATVLFLVAVHAAVVFFPNISFLQNVVYKASFVPTSFQQSPGSMSFTLVTYSSLHADWTHLLNNCAWLVAFGSPVAYVLGLRRFILFWCLCSAVAALTHFLLHPLSAVPMVGASGAVSGMMGAAARAGLKLRVGPNRPFSDLPFPTIVEALASRNVVVFILVYLLVNIGIGLSEVFMPGMSNIAWQAHIGGLLAGFLLFPRFVPQRMS